MVPGRRMSWGSFICAICLLCSPSFMFVGTTFVCDAVRPLSPGVPVRRCSVRTQP